jgi:hypothetical protein
VFNEEQQYLRCKTVRRVRKALERDNISSEARVRKFVARLVVVRELG